MSAADQREAVPPIWLFRDQHGARIGVGSAPQEFPRRQALVRDVGAAGVEVLFVLPEGASIVDSTLARCAHFCVPIDLSESLDVRP